MRFDVEAEIAVQAASSGRLTEVPIAYRKRVLSEAQRLEAWVSDYSSCLWFGFSGLTVATISLLLKNGRTHNEANE